MSTKKADGNAIRISVEESQYARKYSANESFYGSQLGEIKAILERLLKRTQNSKSSPCDKEDEVLGAAHGTIAVLGPRGVGKTSFLLSIEGYLEKDNAEDGDSSGKEIKKSLFFLPLIEPSMMDETEFFIVTLTSLIAEYVENKCRKLRDEEDRKVEEFRKAINELALTFSALTKQSQMEIIKRSAEVPEIAGSQLLTQARSAVHSVRAFRRFVKASLELLSSDSSSNKALVLLLDDVDTNHSKGYEVLDTIRRYLAFPQIIPIVSGDEQLYELLVKMQTAHTIKKLRHAYKDKITPLSVMDHLHEGETQFLLKILPRENRIDLPEAYRNIPRLAINPTLEVVESKNSKHPQTDNRCDIRDLFQRLLYHVFRVRVKGEDKADGAGSASAQEKNLCNYPESINSPIIKGLIPKSNRQFLDFIEQVLLTLPPVSSSSSASPVEPPKSADSIEAPIEGMLKVFKNDWKDLGLALDEIFYGDSDNLEYQFFESFFAKENSSDPYLTDPTIPNFYNLSPQYSERDQNRVILCAQAAFNLLYGKYPERIMKYWLVVCETYLNWEEPEGAEKTQRNNYMKYIHFRSTEQPPDMVSRDIAWKCDNFNLGAGFVRLDITGNKEHRYRCGIASSGATEFDGIKPWVELVKTKNRALIDASSAALYPTWFEFEDWADPVVLALAKLFIVRIAATGKTRRLIYVSFNRGLAAIGELLAEYGKRHRDGSKDPFPSDVLDKWLQDRLYAKSTGEIETDDRPRRGKPKGEEEGENNDGEVDDKEIAGKGENNANKVEDEDKDKSIPPEAIAILKKLFDLWLKPEGEASKTLGVPDVADIPPGHVLSAIWRRCRYNLIAQTTSKKGMGRNTAGKLLRRSAIAFLNSILVEELIWRGDAPKNLNIQDSPLLLCENVKIAHKKGIPAFFAFWLRCPFLLFLLDPKDLSEIIKSLKGEPAEEQSKEQDKKNGKKVIQDCVPASLIELIQKVQLKIKGRDKWEFIEQESTTAYPMLCSLSPWIEMRSMNKEEKDSWLTNREKSLKSFFGQSSDSPMSALNAPQS